MRALYDLGRWLSSYNYFEWQCQAEANGATTVVFDIRKIRGDKWPVAVSLKRFWSICEPGPALIGLPCEVFGPGETGHTNAKDIAQPGGGPLVAFWKSGRRFKRLRSVRPPVTERYTITLRKTQRSPLRDSDEVVWRAFANEIGARVVEDYEVAPIHLHDRMALYAGAEMNFFVSNGPGVLCSLTTFPCMLFNTHHARESLLADGMKEWEQYPWMLKNQRAIWEQATPGALREHFYHWRDTGKFLER